MRGPDGVVIVGAGQAGCEAAFRLRNGGFSGRIRLIGDEGLAPYQRPPLSKKFLTGELETEGLLLRSEDSYQRANIELIRERRVLHVDRAAKRVAIEGGQSLGYDRLILATGGRARRLPIPGADLGGVCVLRSATDVESIRERLRPNARLVVVGAGFVGLEVAAVATSLGVQVAVLEVAPRVLSRAVSPQISAFVEKEHRDHGVDLRCGVQIERFGGQNVVQEVVLSDGVSLPADLALVGVGLSAETQLAADAGLDHNDGVLVNAVCQTSDDAVYAIGDCARRPLAYDGGRAHRLESVHNALETGRLAAAAILGREMPACEAPWFWSDQYAFKLQMAGIANEHDLVVSRGGTTASPFALFYYRGEKLVAVAAVNRPADYLMGKKLIERGLSPASELLADPTVPLKALA